MNVRTLGWLSVCVASAAVLIFSVSAGQELPPGPIDSLGESLMAFGVLGGLLGALFGLVMALISHLERNS